MTKHRPYSIVAYDPEWPQRFQRQAAKIKDVMGDAILAIHH
jgi:GrpB-like predicted nucleotidyltransferase (UPF0157 family)